LTVTVEAKNISLRFGKHHALQNVDFLLTEPKIYGLIGRNGAGKTSLLSILASYREQTGGTLTIGGEEPFENAKVMPLVNFIYSKDYKEESENTKSLLSDAERYRPNFDRGYADSLLKKFNLPENKPLKKFSKGMQAAFDVVSGLASRAPITIFDEAYQGMDAPTRELFYREVLEDQSNHPRIMILSTHLVSEMDYLFDEVLILHKGELLLQEEYETLITKGASITGAAAEVDGFVSSLKQLSEQQLGGTKSVMVFGELSEAKKIEAEQKGLEVGPVSLQDLFIHLTGEDV
jgi:ABC-2 type transport system ATP-binding protein